MRTRAELLRAMRDAVALETHAQACTRTLEAKADAATKAGNVGLADRYRATSDTMLADAAEAMADSLRQMLANA